MIFWTLAVGVLLLIFWLYKLNEDYFVLAFFAKRVKTVDGRPLNDVCTVPEAKTIFGHTFDLRGMDLADIFEWRHKRSTEIGRSFILYIFGIPFYMVNSAEDAELILNDPNFITKGFTYRFLEPFLRTGLLVSTDKKWHARRKLLTPAFHFNILEQFEEVFKEESRKFVSKFQNQKESEISLSECIPKFTLNSVCETALGVQLDDRLDGDEYRFSFKQIEECFIKRVTNPILFIDAFFNLIAASKFSKHLKIVHGFSSGIIEKRRKLFAEENKQNNEEKSFERETNDEDHFMKKKKRYAMLDTLLHAEKDGLIDHIGICEEVDTFMFEGFDTTSMGLTFGLMNLSLYPEMQEKCYQEIIANIDDDLSNLDLQQLNKLRYVECFIKETLRLYPPVPFIARTAVRESKLANNLILPAGTSITVQIFNIQRNPKYFPDPETFNPDRFTQENSAGRHTFAYIPFSAGQRNCIGQRFAMLEMKTLFVYILKNFKLLPLVDPKEFAFEVGLIIRSRNDIKVKLVKRN